MHHRHTVTRVFVLAVLLCGWAGSTYAQEQARRSSMDERAEQVIGLLLEAPDCGAAETAIQLGLELYGGTRPVLTKSTGDGNQLEITREADQKLSAFERHFADALMQFIQEGNCPDLQGPALDLKLFIEMMNEVALAVGRVTQNCNVGDSLQQPPCSQLLPLLDEKTGHEIIGGYGGLIKLGYSVKLRSPFVPWNTTFAWEEDVFVTEPIRKGECVAIVKETRGLMLRLVLVGFDVVKDPWATAQLARGSVVPIWALEWVPSQYVKTWNICNSRGRIRTTVDQRVKQDIPLNFFWRFYPKAGGKYH